MSEFLLLTPKWAIFITARLIYIRWDVVDRCPLCTRPTHYSDSQPRNLCSYTFILNASYQYLSLVVLTGGWTHDITTLKARAITTTPLMWLISVLSQACLLINRDRPCTLSKEYSSLHTIDYLIPYKLSCNNAILIMLNKNSFQHLEYVCASMGKWKAKHNI